jgi:hypothetical protein
MVRSSTGRVPHDARYLSELEPLTYSIRLVSYLGKGFHCVHIIFLCRDHEINMAVYPFFTDSLLLAAPRLGRAWEILLPPCPGQES